MEHLHAKGLSKDQSWQVSSYLSIAESRSSSPEAHEYALINVHPSRCVVKTNKNGSKSVKWKQGGKAYKEIPSFNIAKGDSYVYLANEIADKEQSEALDFLEKVAVVKGVGGDEAKAFALDLYNQFQESKTTIDTYSDNRTGNKYSEWNDEERRISVEQFEQI